MGTQLSTFHLVEAPAVVPYRHGLFSVVEPRVVGLTGGVIDEHWRLGVTWQSQACSLAKETTGPCIDSDVAALTPDEYCSVAEFDPFTVYAYNDLNDLRDDFKYNRDVHTLFTPYEDDAAMLGFRATVTKPDGTFGI